MWDFIRVVFYFVKNRLLTYHISKTLTAEFLCGWKTCSPAMREKQYIRHKYRNFWCQCVTTCRDVLLSFINSQWCVCKSYRIKLWSSWSDMKTLQSLVQVSGVSCMITSVWLLSPLSIALMRWGNMICCCPTCTCWHTHYTTALVEVKQFTVYLVALLSLGVSSNAQPAVLYRQW